MQVSGVHRSTGTQRTLHGRVVIAAGTPSRETAGPSLVLPDGRGSSRAPFATEQADPWAPIRQELRRKHDMNQLRWPNRPMDAQTRQQAKEGAGFINVTDTAIARWAMEQYPQPVGGPPLGFFGAAFASLGSMLENDRVPGSWPMLHRLWDEKGNELVIKEAELSDAEKSLGSGAQGPASAEVARLRNEVQALRSTHDEVVKTIADRVYKASEDGMAGRLGGDSALRWAEAGSGIDRWFHQLFTGEPSGSQLEDERGRSI